jgi:glucose uptake protein GlcU
MLGGVVIFSEWNGLAAVTVGLKIAAVVAILAGVAILSRSSQGHLPQP